MSEKELSEERALDSLKKRIEKHLDWGKSETWHSSMFKDLSDQIFEKCQVVLSATTLKRFFGVVSYDGAPSVNTLDVLSQFAGFENWRDYKQQSKSKKRSFRVPTKTLYVWFGFVLGVVAIAVVSSRRTIDPATLDEITFSSRTVTNTYPNSVVFDFDLKGISSDSIWIQQYWDPAKTIQLESDQTQATGIYYFPGYFRARLWWKERS